MQLFNFFKALPNMNIHPNKAQERFPAPPKVLAPVTEKSPIVCAVHEHATGAMLYGIAPVAYRGSFTS